MLRTFAKVIALLLIVSSTTHAQTRVCVARAGQSVMVERTEISHAVDTEGNIHALIRYEDGKLVVRRVPSTGMSFQASNSEIEPIVIEIRSGALKITGEGCYVSVQ